MLGGRCIGELSFRKEKIGISLTPTLTANNSNSPIEYFFSDLFKNLLPYAIGFVLPSSCFCQSVIPSPVVLASVVTILSFSFA